MRAEVITVIWILVSVFISGAWFGWWAGRRFEKQRRIAAALRAKLVWHRLHGAISALQADAKRKVGQS